MVSGTQFQKGSSMKVEVKKVDALKREMKFEIPREKVTEAMDTVYNEIGKHAKVIGFPSLDKFKSALRRQLESDRDRHNRMDIENQIVEHLLKNAKLVVPQSLVKRQLHHRLHDNLHRLKSQGLSEEELKKK